MRLGQAHRAGRRAPRERRQQARPLLVAAVQGDRAIRARGEPGVGRRSDRFAAHSSSSSTAPTTCGQPRAAVLGSAAVSPTQPPSAKAAYASRKPAGVAHGAVVPRRRPRGRRARSAARARRGTARRQPCRARRRTRASVSPSTSREQEADVVEDQVGRQRLARSSSMCSARSSVGSAGAAARSPRRAPGRRRAARSRARWDRRRRRPARSRARRARPGRAAAPGRPARGRRRRARARRGRTAPGRRRSTARAARSRRPAPARRRVRRPAGGRGSW